LLDALEASGVHLLTDHHDPTELMVGGFMVRTAILIRENHGLRGELELLGRVS
jgi:hypothetical protein